MSPTAVDAWLLALDHPQKEVIAALRTVVCSADPGITEGIKWNAGSFRTTEWFGTFNVRGPKGPRPVTLVLHLGAKVRQDGAEVPDPTGLLTWLGKDRASITFPDAAAVAARAPALRELVRAWVRALG